MALNAICRRDQELWTTALLLICYYIVEWHLPIRVVRQFGGLRTVAMQHEPTSHSSKSYTLHLCVLCFTTNLSSFDINLWFVSCAG
jgi:hypothetical protein